MAERQKEFAYLSGEPPDWPSKCEGFDAKSDPKNKELPVLVTGSCPRCNHRISLNLRPQPGVIVLASNGDESDDDYRYLMTCNCVCGHTGAPEGVHGCGAQGGIKVVDKDGSFHVAYVEVSPEQRNIEAWANEATRNPLAKRRTWAQQWIALLSAVTGLLSFGVVVDVAGDLGALPLGWRLLYATLGGMALICVVEAVVRAWQAANPTKIKELKADCAGRKAAYDTALDYSAARLSDSYGWAVVALLLFAASIVVRILSAPLPS